VHARSDTKYIFWILLHDRVNTRNLLKRKSMQLDCYECGFYNEGVEETLMHLFCDCTFAQACWDTIFTYTHRGISAIACLRETTKVNCLGDHYFRLLEHMDPKDW
jgi:hypothetical protein